MTFVYCSIFYLFYVFNNYAANKRTYTSRRIRLRVTKLEDSCT
jgi:hypothetical protein